MAKIIKPGNVLFEDDVKIIDAELENSLEAPHPLPVLASDEMQIIYNGCIFRAVEKPVKEDYFKIYTMTFSLEEFDNPKTQEDRYFSDNSAVIKKTEESFLEKVVNGISIISLPGKASSISTKSRDLKNLESELSDRIMKKDTISMPAEKPYSGSGRIAKLDDGSVFNTNIKGYERVLIIDSKVYDLITIPEYISIFQGSFEGKFYQDIMEKSSAFSPEEISKILTDNKDKIHQKVLPLVRNKIWHSERSSKLFLDNTYWIPQFREKEDELIKLYSRVLGRKIKLNAAGRIN